MELSKIIDFDFCYNKFSIYGIYNYYCKKHNVDKKTYVSYILAMFNSNKRVIDAIMNGTYNAPFCQTVATHLIPLKFNEPMVYNTLKRYANREDIVKQRTTISLLRDFRRLNGDVRPINAAVYLSSSTLHRLFDDLLTLPKEFVKTQPKKTEVKQNLAPTTDLRDEFAMLPLEKKRYLTGKRVQEKVIESYSNRCLLLAKKKVKKNLEALKKLEQSA